jgi:hypothetical protein
MDTISTSSLGICLSIVVLVLVEYNIKDISGNLQFSYLLRFISMTEKEGWL